MHDVRICCCRDPFDSDSDSDAENDGKCVNVISSSEEEKEQEEESEDEIQLLSSKEISDMKETSTLDLDTVGSSQQEDYDDDVQLGDKELNRILGNMERTAKDGKNVLCNECVQFL